jgi:tRNA(Arg) A34 adenosine deaminase TadA
MFSRQVSRIIPLVHQMRAPFFMPVPSGLLSAVSIGGATFFSYFYTLLPLFGNKMELNPEDRKFLKLAIATASDNIKKQGGPFGAVIVSQGKIISSAGNSVVTGHDPTAHAEVQAIRKAAETLGTHDLSGCVIYSSCEPCPMCLGAIYWAGIRRLVYASDRYKAAASGFDDEMIYTELALDHEKRSIIMNRGMKDEGDSVFRQWDTFPGKVLY